MALDGELRVHQEEKSGISSKILGYNWNSNLQRNF